VRAILKEAVILTDSYLLSNIRFTKVGHSNQNWSTASTMLVRCD